MDSKNFFLTNGNQEPNINRLHCEICSVLFGPVVYSRKQFPPFAAECYLRYCFNEQVTAVEFMSVEVGYLIL